jgi:hypothetical protein
MIKVNGSKFICIQEKKCFFYMLGGIIIVFVESCLNKIRGKIYLENATIVSGKLFTRNCTQNIFIKSCSFN